MQAVLSTLRGGHAAIQRLYASHFNLPVKNTILRPIAGATVVAGQHLAVVIDQSAVYKSIVNHLVIGNMIVTQTAVGKICLDQSALGKIRLDQSAGGKLIVDQLAGGKMIQGQSAEGKIVVNKP